MANQCRQTRRLQAVKFALSNVQIQIRSKLLHVNRALANRPAKGAAEFFPMENLTRTERLLQIEIRCGELEQFHPPQINTDEIRMVEHRSLEKIRVSSVSIRG